MFDSSAAWFVSSIICLLFTVFNILTIFVILCTKSLRKKVTIYPILYFLTASAIQGFIAFPLYVFKKLAYKHDVPTWLCDTSRFTYMHSGHVLKISLLLVSFDRLFAVKYPFRYHVVASRHNMAAVIVITWVITVVVDSMPFLNGNESFESCHYVPTRVWGLCVIVCYDLLPFLLIAVNYITIWFIAARLSLADSHLKADLNQLKYKSCQVPKETRTKSKAEMLLEMKATKTSFMLLLVYIVCWAPLGVFYTYDHFCKNCLSTRAELGKTRAAIKILSSTSSVFAPIIYCWWNREFCKAAETLLQKLRCKFFPRKNSERINLVYKYSSSNS